LHIYAFPADVHDPRKGAESVSSFGDLGSPALPPVCCGHLPDGIVVPTYMGGIGDNFFAVTVRGNVERHSQGAQIIFQKKEQTNAAIVREQGF
jgi:hypothetical protein